MLGTNSQRGTGCLFLLTEMCWGENKDECVFRLLKIAVTVVWSSSQCHAASMAVKTHREFSRTRPGPGVGCTGGTQESESSEQGEVIFLPFLFENK